MHFKNARRNRIRKIRRKIHALHIGTQKDCNRYFHYYIRSFPVSLGLSYFFDKFITHYVTCTVYINVRSE